MPNIKYSPLHSLHVKNKAKFIEFGGWTMPFSYKGTIKEHQFVRQNHGYFDVSHMGRLLIDKDYLQKISSLICSDLLELKSGKALYSIFTNEKGSALDDVIFWKYDDYILLICNAANTDKITNYLQTEEIIFQDLTEKTALVAVQGPEAISNLKALLPIPDSFSCLSKDMYTYARTGYTGEDGLEIMVNVEDLDEFNFFSTPERNRTMWTWRKGYFET
jgi:aminomethyltransferase